VKEAKELGLDLIFAAEHVVDGSQIVDALGDGLGVAAGGVVLLEVGLFAKFAHLWQCN